MAKLTIKAGATSKLARIFIADSTKTDGSGLAGLTNASSGLTWYYFLEGAASSVAVSIVSATLGTWTSGGFKEMDATHMTGWYEIGIPNAALASGQSVAMHLQGAASMMPVPIEIQFVSYDPYDTVRLGLTAIPNTTPGASGGAFIAGSNAATTVNFTGNVSGSVGSVGSGGITAASFAAWSEAYTTKGTGSTYTIDKLLWDIHQAIYSPSTASTTLTVRQIDNSTAAHTLTLNDATNPTAAAWAT